MLSFLKYLHTKFIFTRRVKTLAGLLSELIPAGASVLDIGCGDGSVGYLIGRKRNVRVQGLEVIARLNCRIECKIFDGQNLPLESRSVDVCLFTDVLHHTLTVKELLSEAYRVSRKYVLIKDHLCKNKIDFAILKLMDWVGNRPYGVNLVYNYQSKEKWLECLSNCKLKVIIWDDNLLLYPFPFNILFGKNLHFIALLEKI